MSTATGTFIIAHNSDAEFRVWAAGVIALLTATGLTQTSDTGQINTGTATRPGINTAGGYTIWRFNDSLQSTRPIFFKLEFGTAASTTAPAMWLTIGTGSDGAGTITNIVRGRTQINFSGSASAVLSHACYNSTLGAFWFHVNAAYTTSSFISMILARLCDDNDTPNDIGVIWSWHVSQGAPASYSWVTGTTVNVFPWSFPLAPAATTLLKHGIDPVIFVANVTCDSQMYGAPVFMGCVESDWPPLADVESAPYGTDRTYKAFTGPGCSYGFDIANDVNTRALMLWE